MSKQIIGIILSCFLAASVLAGKIAPLPEVMKPGAIKVDGNELFVTEGSTVSVYCLESFKLKHSFGKRGEGPGEFKYGPSISIFKDYIHADSMSKFSRFTREGRLMGEVKKKGRGSLYPVRDNFVFQASGFDFKNRRVNIDVQILDKRLGKIKDIYKGQLENVDFHLSSDTGKEDKVMTPHFFGVEAADGKIYIADSKKGFYLEVYDHTGKKLETIDIKMKDIRVGDDFKKNAMDERKKSKFWERMKNNNFIFYRNFPKIKSFSAGEDRIYVQTHLEKNGKNEFVVLNPKGQILKKIFLPAKDTVYTFLGNAFYYLKENENEEEWELFKVNVL